MNKRYKVYNTNKSGKSTFRSYINGYVDTLKEAKESLKRELKHYPKRDLELHLVDFNENYLRKVNTILLK